MTAHSNNKPHTICYSTSFTNTNAILKFTHCYFGYAHALLVSLQ